ncbi:MAG TPA: cation diffusion facilitator family transporter [Rhodospirillales bacterium]|nr:cation diffusion facilitator family transporter [Rhodospirillales bacterium]
MSACCNHDVPVNEIPPSYRRVLWIALTVNAAMFVIEIIAGLLGNSLSLQADALDFFADAANYGISLMVLGMSVRWRAGTALAKGIAMGVFGLLVLAFAMYRAFFEQTPDVAIMGGVGFLALAANGGVAWMLFKYRAGDSNMRSVWLCSRNDAIANIAVLLAASGVWATGTGWPDLAVGVLIAGLALGSGLQVVIQARQELATA